MYICNWKYFKKKICSWMQCKVWSLLCFNHCPSFSSRVHRSQDYIQKVPKVLFATIMVKQSLMDAEDSAGRIFCSSGCVKNINGNNAQTPRVLSFFCRSMDRSRQGSSMHALYTVRFTTRTGEGKDTAWLWRLSAKLFCHHG